MTGSGEARSATREVTGSDYERKTQTQKNGGVVMITILIVILVLALIGALPAWPYSRGWGYYPSGGVGLIVLVLLILLLVGRI